MSRLRAGIDRVLEAALALLMASMVLNVLWQVFTRLVLRAPSSLTEELARFALIWLGLLGASYGFGRRQHLAIELLPEALAARAGAAGRALEIAIQLCVAAFALLVLVVGGSRLVALTLALEQTSAALGVRLGFVYLALPISGAIVVFYALAAIAAPAARGRRTG